MTERKRWVVKTFDTKEFLTDGELSNKLGQVHVTDISLMTVRDHLQINTSDPIGIINELKEMNKIPAIKMIRAITGCGLKEGKDFIESLGEKPRPVPLGPILESFPHKM